MGKGDAYPRMARCGHGLRARDQPHRGEVTATVTHRSVHVIVVAYHAAGALADCLAALDQQVAVTVVDNSASAAVAAVAARHGATYLDCGGNRGFAAGVNAGLEQLMGDESDVLLLNPDAMITPTAIRTLARFMHESTNSQVCAVAPHLHLPDGSEQRVLWPFPTPGRMCVEAVGLGSLGAGPQFAVASVLLLRREAIVEVGTFDERFFLYAEETDWQRRAFQRGGASRVLRRHREPHRRGN